MPWGSSEKAIIARLLLEGGQSQKQVVRLTMHSLFVFAACGMQQDSAGCTCSIVAPALAGLPQGGAGHGPGARIDVVDSDNSAILSPAWFLHIGEPAVPVVS